MLLDSGPGPVWQDIASSTGRDWLPFWNAVELLEPKLGKLDAANALIGRVYAGMIAVTCMVLEYQDRRNLGDIRRYNWPGTDSKLSEQMRHAHETRQWSQFNINPITGDAHWNAFRHNPPTLVKVWGLHVDRADVEAMGMERARLTIPPAADEASCFSEPAAAPPDPAAVAPEPAMPREQTLKQFVLACVESGIASWTVAYSKHYKPAVSEGRVAQKSRAQFEAAYKEHYPNPKSGPKSGG